MATLLLSFLSFAGGCTSQEKSELAEAQSESEKGNFRIALSILEKITIRSPQSQQGIEAAREAAKLSFYEVKDFQKAARFYRLIVLSSPDADERMLAQKQIVSIYFDQLTDYQKAIIEINKLLVMLTDPREKTDYKMKLARAYYYQNNFTQAENEADEFLATNPSMDLKFDMIFLKGNIALAKKDLPTAVAIFKSLLQEFPERAIKDNVGLTLSVCYEEMKDFKAAIEVLEKLKNTHPMPEYIDIRIKRLQDRLKNQPGAKGRIRK
jgi:tetratricopeptide (TPR) repeat protein